MMIFSGGSWLSKIYNAQLASNPSARSRFNKWYNNMMGMSKSMRQKHAQVYQAKVEMTCDEAVNHAREASYKDRLKKVRAQLAEVRAELNKGK